jgi:hypothetical protein
MNVTFDPPPYLQRMFSFLVRPLVVNAVRLRNVVDTEEGEPDSLVAVLEFNDSHSDPGDPGDHGYVDLNQLRSSLNGTGNYFIWTCSCGYPGCAGLVNGVDVTHSNGKTIWHDLDMKRRFVLESKDLCDSFENAISDGRNMLLQRPDCGCTPEENESAYRYDG